MKKRNAKRRDRGEIQFPYQWTPLAVTVTPRIHTYLQTEEAKRLIHAIERPARKLGEKITEIMREEAREKQAADQAGKK